MYFRRKSFSSQRKKESNGASVEDLLDLQYQKFFIRCCTNHGYCWMAWSFWPPMCLLSHFNTSNTQKMWTIPGETVQIKKLTFCIYQSSCWYTDAVYSAGPSSCNLGLCSNILDFHISVGCIFSKTNATKNQVLHLSVWELDCQLSNQLLDLRIP